MSRTKHSRQPFKIQRGINPDASDLANQARRAADREISQVRDAADVEDIVWVGKKDECSDGRD